MGFLYLSHSLRRLKVRDGCRTQGMKGREVSNIEEGHIRRVRRLASAVVSPRGDYSCGKEARPYSKLTPRPKQHLLTEAIQRAGEDPRAGDDAWHDCLSRGRDSAHQIIGSNEAPTELNPPIPPRHQRKTSHVPISYS